MNYDLNAVASLLQNRMKSTHPLVLLAAYKSDGMCVKCVCVYTAHKQQEKKIEKIERKERIEKARV